MERAQLLPADLDTRMGSDSSVFSRFLTAERNRVMADSLSEAMGMQAPFNLPHSQAQQQVKGTHQVDVPIRFYEYHFDIMFASSSCGSFIL